MAANQLIAYLERGEIVNSVNLPCMQLPMTFTNRVCVIHKDADGVQANIAAALGGCQIASLTSCSKNGWAYTVADFSGNADKAKIEKVDGVVKVRVI
jgi:D-3-phosphoglycerate dehydrogenase